MRTGAANHPKRVKPTQTVAQPRPGLVRHSGMPPPRLALVLGALTALLAIAAPVALADPPWSTPAPLPGAGNGPAPPPPRGHLPAIVSANRSQPPNAASQLLRLEPTTGAVQSSTPVDLAGAAITAHAGDSIAVAGPPIGPPGTVDTQGPTRVGTTRGATG